MMIANKKESNSKLHYSKQCKFKPRWINYKDNCIIKWLEKMDKKVKNKGIQVAITDIERIQKVKLNIFHSKVQCIYFVLTIG
jgi:hypothetical protein